MRAFFTWLFKFDTKEWYDAASPKERIVVNFIKNSILGILSVCAYAALSAIIGLNVYARFGPFWLGVSIALTLSLPILALSFVVYLHQIRSLARPVESTPVVPPQVAPIRPRLEASLRTAIPDQNYNLPPPELFERMLTVAEELWHQRYHLATSSIEIAGPTQERDDRMYDAIEKVMLAYLARLPPFIPKPFWTAITNQINTPALMMEMTEPFRSIRGLGNNSLPFILRFNANAGMLGPADDGKTMWPGKYKGPNIAETYLAGTPLLPLFQTLVPYNPFTENNRCAHHWCLGRNQMGKSTFLRHLIWDDLQRAAKGECSVVIIDSKSMVNHMRELDIFGPGQPLDGNLILIDSDVRFPLNPFYIGSQAQTQSEKEAAKLRAKELISYMLANLDPAPGQERALPFFVEATLHSRDKSLAQLHRYVQMDPDTLPAELKSFPANVADWFRTTRKGLYSSTKDGLDQRLASFIDKQKHTPFYKNLNAGRWGNRDGNFDLFDELHQGGKVLLVDTDNQKNGDEGTNLMGRLFIAMLREVMERRMKLDKKPIFVYIDEAADYLTYDKSFVKILTRAGEARVGMTVAYQFKGQPGVDPDMEKALNNASIHSECIAVGGVEVTINQRTQLSLPVQRFEFKEQTRMDFEDYKKMRQYLSFEYPYKDAPLSRDIDEEPLTQKNV